MTPQILHPYSCSAALVLAALTACATPGTRPHEMSEAGHEQAAAAEEKEAARLKAACEGASGVASEECRDGQDRVWWWSVTNPTEANRKQAERHVKAAQEHRAAAKALAQAEATACGGIPEIDKDMSPFAHREDIESVAQLFEQRDTARKVVKTLQGARIAFRPVPGLTQARLQRLLDCHLSRNAVMGHQVADMDYCPLVPNGVTATVVPRGGRLFVDVESDKGAAAQEIWARALKIGAPEVAAVVK